MNEEQLIELVKRYPVLYDTSLAVYRDHTVRNNAWEGIAEQLNTNADEVKNKWGKLRNCYTNALKRQRKKSRAVYRVPWKFEKQMKFLLPHIELRSKDTNLVDTNDDDSRQEFEVQFSEESVLSPLSTTSSRASVEKASTPDSSRKRIHKNDDDNNFLREFVDVTTPVKGQNKQVTDMDENDYFFLSMSKQLKKLPRTDQVQIKFQLHKLIHDAEMKMLNNVIEF